MQEINDDLIADFFKGLCTTEDAAKVIEYLKQHPDHPYLLREWNMADSNTPLPGDYSAAMFDAVVAQTTNEDKPVVRIKFLWRIAAAACVAAVFVCLWMVSVKKNSTPETAPVSQAEKEEWVARLNTKDTAVVLLLDDGSKITLSPKAYVRYRKNFTQLKSRGVYLEGEAFFEVAKNRQKPFTVYSNYISTTALGTAFRVTAAANGDSIKVRLVEGKVVVAVTDTVYKNVHADYYLSPGQELVFKSKSKPAFIYAFNKKNIVVHGTPGNMSAAKPGMDESYMFNNQTLADVLDQLAAIYQVKIEYSKTDIGQMYFIGRIDKNDAVEKTISDIALLNKLSVKKKNGGFILTRKKH